MQDPKCRTNLGFSIGQMFKLEEGGMKHFSGSQQNHVEDGFTASSKRGVCQPRHRRSSIGYKVGSSQDQTAITTILKKETNIDNGPVLSADAKEQSFSSFMGDKTYDNVNRPMEGSF